MNNLTRGHTTPHFAFAKQALNEFHKWRLLNRQPNDTESLIIFLTGAGYFKKKVVYRMAFLKAYQAALQRFDGNQDAALNEISPLFPVEIRSCFKRWISRFVLGPFKPGDSEEIPF